MPVVCEDDPEKNPYTWKCDINIYYILFISAQFK